MAEQAAQLLRERIRAGEWQLGHRLPGETTLAAQLGVGRSTVREAIAQLAGSGMLDSRQGAGVFVTALDVVEDWDAILRDADIVAVLEARTAIEADAAAHAARRRTPADLRAMRAALAARAAEAESGASIEALVDADTAFHRSVVVAAHNEVLLEMFDAFVPRVRRSMVEMLRVRPVVREDADHADHGAHEDLLIAIRAGKAQEAAAVSRTHLTALIVDLS
ncbi:FadR/GntR family transcriptional regulator [Tomitella biformata]|uniref:FadR/GntR family transcriptional regulator n=1 Tax=Tomitella biformata TaxID=630403 RepID=UPI0004BB65F3|nr:FCD domain-containing protein [Tomitella biformata]